MSPRLAEGCCRRCVAAEVAAAVARVQQTHSSPQSLCLHAVPSNATTWGVERCSAATPGSFSGAAPLNHPSPRDGNPLVHPFGKPHLAEVSGRGRPPLNDDEKMRRSRGPQPERRCDTFGREEKR